MPVEPRPLLVILEEDADDVLAWADGLSFADAAETLGDLVDTFLHRAIPSAVRSNAALAIQTIAGRAVERERTGEVVARAPFARLVERLAGEESASLRYAGLLVASVAFPLFPTGDPTRKRIIEFSRNEVHQSPLDSARALAREIAHCNPEAQQSAFSMGDTTEHAMFGPVESARVETRGDARQTRQVFELAIP